jgi:hypothetical protein
VRPAEALGVAAGLAGLAMVLALAQLRRRLRVAS